MSTDRLTIGLSVCRRGQGILRTIALREDIVRNFFADVVKHSV